MINSQHPMSLNRPSSITNRSPVRNNNKVELKRAKTDERREAEGDVKSPSFDTERYVLGGFLDLCGYVCPSPSSCLYL